MTDQLKQHGSSGAPVGGNRLDAEIRAWWDPVGVPASMGRPADDTQEFDRMDPLVPYRAANLIIQQHGVGAKAYAVQRMQDMRAVGDEHGAWAWMGIFDAVLVLEATKPADGEATH